MSTPSEPPTSVHLACPFAPAPRRSWLGAAGAWLLRALLVVSILLNAFLLIRYLPELTGGRLPERFHSGDEQARAKVALVQIRGMIMEGFTSYAGQQLKDAAQDPEVHAVVLAINSPGGSVTASDQIWKQIKDLRDGKIERQDRPKPVVAALESLAASGGYYIAVPAQRIIAQPTTITGSIGVYAAFLDIHELAQKHGVAMNYLKRGELKASGSMFKPMTPEDKLEWEGLIDNSFERFLNVVHEGRDGQPGGKRLKRGLREEFSLAIKGLPPQTRRIADGGVYTAQQALELGLVDDIGYLDDAIREAKKLAGLSEARVVSYERPVSLTELFLGIQARPGAGVAELCLGDMPGLSARLWYLSPGHEWSGLPLSILRRE